MGKKQNASLADILSGNTQPISANNQPERYEPLQPGETLIDDRLAEFNKTIQWPDPSSDRYKLPYSGKYYKGSAYDRSQKTIQGENQPWVRKLANGVAGNTLSVFTKIGTGISETLGGAVDLVTNILPGVAADRNEEYGTRFPHMFENFLTKGFRKIEDETLKEKLFPVYGGQKYYSDSLWSQMGDMKFWSGDLADAVAFTASMYASALAFSKAAKTLGYVTKTVNEFGKPVINLSTKGKLLAQVGTATYSTATEAALEAYDGLRNMREVLAQKYYHLPYASLEISEKQRVNQEAGPKAANIFNTNVGILAGPNLIMSRFMLGPVKNTSTKIKNAIRTGTYKASDVKILRKALKQGGIGVLSEGAWEEGMQDATQRYEESRADGSTQYGFLPGMLTSYVEGYYDTEGLKSRLLGAMIGLGMGAASKAKEVRAEQQEITDYEKNWKEIILPRLKSARNLFPADIKSPYRARSTV